MNTISNVKLILGNQDLDIKEAHVKFLYGGVEYIEYININDEILIETQDSAIKCNFTNEESELILEELQNIIDEKYCIIKECLIT